MIYPILNRRDRRLRSAQRQMLRFESLETRAVLTATLLVPDVYPSIQAAVDAASAGDKIRVASATYTESVTINKDNLEIKASHKLGAIVKPVSHANFIFFVEGAKNVKIEGFEVSGPFDTTDPAGFAGIKVGNGGSAKIKDNLITQIRNNPLSSIQEGIGILVAQPNVPGTTKAEIEDNVITDYQKGGIVVSVGLGTVPVGSIVAGAKAYAEIEDNVITGVGLTDVIGQNGIQISDKASAKIEKNKISGNLFVDPLVAGTAGILVTDDAGPTEISKNKVFGNQIGIWVIDTSNVEVENNDVYNNVEGGIFVDNSFDVEISKNDVFNNDFYGISAFGSTDVEISGNDVFGNGLNGIFLWSSSSIKVSKNEVCNNGFAATTDDDGAGIQLLDSTDNKISDNEIEDNASYGLYLDLDSFDNFITKNEFDDNVDGAILDLAGPGANTYSKNKFR